MRPSLIWPIDAVSWSIIDSTWLPIRSVRAGPLPLYGTCSSFRLACRISSSIARWFDEPLPAEAMLTRPGLDWASEKYSWNDETGVLGATVSTIGTDWIGPTATRSLSGS